MSYSAKVGERLRAIRIQKALSLQEVEALSKKLFKASVLGAYERGEREISVRRMEGLARFYEVPVDRLLPREYEPAVGYSVIRQPGGVAFDLVKVAEGRDPSNAVIKRFCSFIQLQRGDFNGKVITVRTDDLKAIAGALDVPLEELSEKIEDLEILAAV